MNVSCALNMGSVLLNSKQAFKTEIPRMSARLLHLRRIIRNETIKNSCQEKKERNKVSLCFVLLVV